MSEIVSDKPLKSTCCVCGEPVGALAILPDPFGVKSKCQECGGQACPKHLNHSTHTCTKCSERPGDWCKTPPLPKMPPLF